MQYSGLERGNASLPDPIPRPSAHPFLLRVDDLFGSREGLARVEAPGWADAID